MLHINDLRYERLRSAVKRLRALRGCDIATRYAYFRDLAKGRPVIREVVLSDTLVGTTTTIITIGGYLRTVEWRDHCYNKNWLSSWQTYRGLRKHELAYLKGAKVMMLVGWKG